MCSPVNESSASVYITGVQLIRILEREYNQGWAKDFSVSFFLFFFLGGGGEVPETSGLMAQALKPPRSRDFFNLSLLKVVWYMYISHVFHLLAFIHLFILHLFINCYLHFISVLLTSPLYCFLNSLFISR